MSENKDDSGDDKSPDNSPDSSTDRSDDSGVGISDDQLPDDLVPSEDNPLAEGLPDGETADDDLLAGADDADDDADGADGADDDELSDEDD